MKRKPAKPVKVAIVRKPAKPRKISKPVINRDTAGPMWWLKG